MADTEIAHLLDQMMRRVHVGLQACAPDFDTHGIGPGGGMMLMALSDIAPAPIHALVAEVARDKSQITRVLKMLDGKGLISRSMSEADARVCLIDLTPEGRATVKTLQLALAGVIDEVLAPLEASEKATLTALLSRISLRGG